MGILSRQRLVAIGWTQCRQGGRDERRRQIAERSFINETGRALPPLRTQDRRHPHFLQWHREGCFKQWAWANGHQGVLV